jgi:hypothetical protein
MHPYIAKNLSLDPMTKKKPPLSPSSPTASPLHPCSLLLMYTSKNHTKQNILLFKAAAQATKLIPRL